MQTMYAYPISKQVSMHWLLHHITCRFDNNVTGGESTLLDMLPIVEEVKKHRKHFKALSRIPATFIPYKWSVSFSLWTIYICNFRRHNVASIYIVHHGHVYVGLGELRLKNALICHAVLLSLEKSSVMLPLEPIIYMLTLWPWITNVNYMHNCIL